MRDPEKDKECLRRYQEMQDTGRTRMFDWLDYWAKERSDELAIIEYDTGEEVTWKEFALKTKAMAAKLLSMGIKKGDVVATTLVLLKEHVFLMYACYRIGAIIAPLDPRLKTHELDRCFTLAKPKAYFFLGKTPAADFRPMVKEIMAKHSDTCKHWIQFQKEEDEIIDGAISVGKWASDIKKIYIIQGLLLGKVKKAQKKVDKRDPCLIIFTTGSTGRPKPALICHENILIQNIGLLVAFMDPEGHNRMLVNLPPSHVGCTTEQLATPLYGGGTVVILHIFDAAKSLDAIQKYKVTAFGQIPALFNMEWRLPDYDKYDLSSLRFALYGGQAVTRKFLEKLSTMAPTFGTGLGLTETAGFCTYTPLDGTVDDILASVGYDMPLCPISIREPMKPDGTAGDEKPPGEIGEICFTGKQIFLGYLNDPENTAKTISKDGVLYTGDLGSYDEKGLHFAGRSKLLIKPKGYNVFPTEVEDFITQRLKEKVGIVAVVGVPHEVFTEGIMAFVEKKKDAKLTADEVMAVCKDMAAYKRPSHVEIIEQGEMPLNRVAKIDYMVLKDRGKEIVEKLRKEGKWDA
ncbi:MAG: class I adenylate-forming enzyme family protein [Promethearchaeota archaeon]